MWHVLQPSVTLAVAVCWMKACIGYNIVKPTITDCRIVGNGVVLTCQWIPAVQDSTISQTFYYKYFYESKWFSCSISPKPDNCVSCPLQTPGRCQVNDFKHHNFSVVVEAKSVLQPNHSVFSLEALYDPSTIVEPNPVSKLAVLNQTVTSVSATISWTEPAEDETVIYVKNLTLTYRVNYTSSRQQAAASVTLTATRVTLNDLAPYTQYEVTVEARPLSDANSSQETGFWSASSSVSFTTLTDVPGALPNVTAGGFQVDGETSANDTVLTVYWQHIPPPYRHGLIVYYIVTIYCWSNNSQAALCNIRQVPGDQQYDKVTLQAGLFYSLTVEGATYVGRNTSLRPPRIHLSYDVDILGLKQVDRCVALRDKSSRNVHVMWSQSEAHIAVSHYTVYWCPSPMDGLLCKKGLQWTHAPANLTSHTFTLPSDVTDARFACSVQYRHPDITETIVSSGLRWSLCTYDLHRGVLAPLRLTANGAGRLMVTWERPGCTDSGYISTFLLAYCDVTMNQCNNDTVTMVDASDPDVVHYELLIPNVTDGHTYRVRARSLSPLDTARPSHWTNPVSVYVTINTDGQFRILYLVGAVAGVMVFIIVLIVLLIRRQKTRDCCKTYAFNVPMMTNRRSAVQSRTGYSGYDYDSVAMGEVGTM